MAWEIRHGRSYFYLSQKLPGGKVQKKYLGKGWQAEIESLRLATKAEVRRQVQEERQRTAMAESLLEQQLLDASDLAHATMISIGYINEKSRGWRKLPMIAMNENDSENTEALPEGNGPDFSEMVKAARRGDRSVIPALRKMLWENSDLVKNNGDLAAQTQIHWFDLIAGKDLYFRECLLLKVAELKNQLIEEANGNHGQPPAVVKMLADQAVSTWLQLNYHENCEATDPAKNVQLGLFRLRKIESAFNRHMRSLNALTSIRVLNFNERMNEAMRGLVPPNTNKIEQQAELVTPSTKHAKDNRLSNWYSRSPESESVN